MASDNHPIRVGHFGMSNTMGGAETFILNLAENIDRERFRLEVITPFGDHVAHERLVNAIGEDAIHVVDSLGRPLSYWRGVMAVLDERKFDIVHIHRNSAANVVPVVASVHTANRPAILVHAHNSSSGAGVAGRFLHRVNRRYLDAKTDCRLACSHVAGSYLFGRSDYAVVPNGIDAEKYRFNPETRRRIRAEMGIKPDETLIGNVARVVPEKNQRYLIDLMRMLSRENAGFKLMIVGDGPCLSDLEKYASEECLSGLVLFMGMRHDVGDLLQAMDVFALPSLFEGLPMVLVEAQAAGLPCLVSTEVSGEVDITDLVTHLDLGMPLAWVDEVKRRRKAASDRGFRASEVTEAGYGVLSSVNQVEKHYDGLLGR